MSSEDRELVRSQRYLAVRLAMVNTQVENLLEDYRGGLKVKERLAVKMKESQGLKLILSRLSYNKNC